jgi:hypothetical protein
MTSRTIRLWFVTVGVLTACSFLAAQDVRLPKRLGEVFEPVFMFVPASNGGSLITEPGGAVRFLYRTGPGHEGSGSFLYEDISQDGGESWFLEQLSLDTGRGSRSEIAEVHPFTGEIYLMFTRGDGRLLRTRNRRTLWSEEMRLPFRVSFTTGSFIWLREEEPSGFHRLLAAVPAEGGVVTYYSDDDGLTWSGPSNLIFSPEVPGRWDNPAGSPQMVELENGKLWMLTRNSQDHLWESFSDDWGKSWSDARPSRFIGVFSNVRLKRISDGRLLVLWLNSMPQSGVTLEGSFHNTARDVLHAAVSEDDGLTWIGFREVALDSRRHDMIYSRVPAYDAGIHHQKFTVTEDNKVIVFTGQDDDEIGRESLHRQALIFDLGWLYESSRFTDFSQGYEDLNVFKLSSDRWGNTNYYSRVPGATLIEHPGRPFRRVLHLGREKCDWVFNDQDGACWNFPIGRAGSLETRIRLRKGFAGGLISLTNCFYNPSDVAGEAAAMYVFDIPADRKIDVATTLEPERWYTIRLEWTGTLDDQIHSCRVFVDGVQQPGSLRLLNPSPDGICYVRFRSTAPQEDLAGFLVESIRAEITW